MTVTPLQAVTTHLRGRSFINLISGKYAVSVTHVAAEGQTLAAWQAQLKAAIARVRNDVSARL